jgi:hypothetical protein
MADRFCRSGIVRFELVVTNRNKLTELPFSIWRYAVGTIATTFRKGIIQSSYDRITVKLQSNYSKVSQ